MAAGSIRSASRRGSEHESNGQAGNDSRSINIAYVQPIVHFSMPWSTQLTLAPKIYYYLQKSENSDIAKYRDYTDFQIRYGRPDGLELFTTLRKGNHGKRPVIPSGIRH
ncbi:phospholipase A [Robbsia andropogonis]|uniref:phospholipase A n=1 Tax=Robbsia andropogonis TaxID=28092 RepID=UPI003D25822A